MENQPVAAVCGNEVRVYGAVETVNGKSRRPFKYAKKFSNPGQARSWAMDHDDAGKKSK